MLDIFLNMQHKVFVFGTLIKGHIKKNPIPNFDYLVYSKVKHFCTYVHKNCFTYFDPKTLS